MVDVNNSYRDNRIDNCHNGYQGTAKKVLCVCSAGLLRSPTAAWVLGQEPFSYNTRSAGCIKEYALILVDEVLLEWADEVVCMSDLHLLEVSRIWSNAFPSKEYTKPAFSLKIPDNFEYKNLNLIEAIKTNYRKIVLGEKNADQ